MILMVIIILITIRVIAQQSTVVNSGQAPFASSATINARRGT